MTIEVDETIERINEFDPKTDSDATKGMHFQIQVRGRRFGNTQIAITNTAAASARWTAWRGKAINHNRVWNVVLLALHILDFAYTLFLNPNYTGVVLFDYLIAMTRGHYLARAIDLAFIEGKTTFYTTWHTLGMSVYSLRYCRGQLGRSTKRLRKSKDRIADQYLGSLPISSIKHIRIQRNWMELGRSILYGT